MKTLLHIFTALLLAGSALAQQNTNMVLSANYKLLLKQQSKPLLNKTTSNEYVSAFIKTNSLFNANKLTAIGVKIGTQAGTIYTVQIPLDKLEEITAVKGITIIQLDEPIFNNMDVARKSSRVDSVHQAINLPQAYTGKNVVVGIIDAGFDYSHPTFYDTLGLKLRVKRVWEQHKTGTPPAGYTYGNELTDTSAMLISGNDVSSFSHGTHVGGIAAGSGLGSTTNKHRGVAYQSELVFVGIKPEKSEWKTMGMTSIVDAVNYIFTYAKSVNKPAVVNLSWGCSIGPNDGSSLFSQAIDNLTGMGKIFVLSAGNNGDENIHISKSFSKVDTALNSFITFPTINGQNRTWIDVWGEKKQQFSVQLALYNASTRVSSTNKITLQAGLVDTFLVGSTNDTCFLSIVTSAADYNGKPHVLIDAYTKSTNALGLTLIADTGKTHAWLGYVNDYNGYYGAFSSQGKTWAVNGDNSYTLGEMSSTKTAITVAAYVSKNNFKNIIGSTVSYSGYAFTSAIAPFSSKGPTVDGRRKPDIAAPGMTIASAVNSYDLSYASGGGNYAQTVSKYTAANNRDYYYGEASGTSMSSPMISGIVALMLEANPLLGPQQIKDYLASTAIRDSYTGLIPDSTRWGVGKVNAYAMVKKVILHSGINEVPNYALNTLSVYPNPSNGSFWFEFETVKAGNTQIMVYDLMGKTVFETIQACSTGLNKMEITPLNLTPGIYVLKVKVNGVEVNSRLLVE
jgi:minor extracellular serine protease Vpr